MRRNLKIKMYNAITRPVRFAKAIRRRRPSSPEVQWLREKSFRWTRLRNSWAYVIPLGVGNVAILRYDVGDSAPYHIDDLQSYDGTHLRVNYVWQHAERGGEMIAFYPEWVRHVSDRLFVLAANQTYHEVTGVESGTRVVISYGVVVPSPLDLLLTCPRGPFYMAPRIHTLGDLSSQLERKIGMALWRLASAGTRHAA